MPSWYVHHLQCAYVRPLTQPMTGIPSLYRMGGESLAYSSLRGRSHRASQCVYALFFLTSLSSQVVLFHLAVPLLNFTTHTDAHSFRRHDRLPVIPRAVGRTYLSDRYWEMDHGRIHHVHGNESRRLGSYCDSPLAPRSWAPRFTCSTAKGRACGASRPAASVCGFADGWMVVAGRKNHHRKRSGVLRILHHHLGVLPR
jgi:hypothetical protein